jgi:hypothetical protein
MLKIITSRTRIARQHLVFGGRCNWPLLFASCHAASSRFVLRSEARQMAGKMDGREASQLHVC